MITSVLAGLTPGKDAIFHLNGSQWTKFNYFDVSGEVTYRMTGGPFGLVVTQSLGYGDSTWLVHPDRNIQLAGTGTAGDEGFRDGATYASTNTAQYRLSADGQKVEQVDIYGGAPVPGGPQAWTEVGGAASGITAHSWGLVAVEPTYKNLFQFMGSPGQWTQIGGPGKQFAVTGDALFGLTPDGGAVFQYDGSGKWTVVGGQYSSIQGGTWGLIATDAAGDLYHYDNQPNQWTKIGGPGAMFAVGDNTVYGLTPGRDAVFEYNPGNGSWTKIGGPASAIVVYGVAQ